MDGCMIIHSWYLYLYLYSSHVTRLTFCAFTDARQKYFHPANYHTCHSSMLHAYCKKVPKIVKIITITKPSALGMSDPLMDQFNMGRRVDWGAQLTVVFGFLGTPCLMKIWYMLLASLGWEGDENRRRNKGEGETYREVGTRWIHQLHLPFNSVTHKNCQKV